MQDFLQRTFLGNTVESYCWFVGILIGWLLLRKLVSKLLTLFVFHFLKKYSTGVGVEKLLSLLRTPLSIFLLLVSLYLAFFWLEFPPHWHMVPRGTFGVKMIIFRSFEAAVILSITWIVLRIVDFFGVVMLHRASQSHSKSDTQLVPFFKESVKIIIAVFSLFFLLGAVFHINVASLIAGLGIGGLAVALAAKESIENLLASFTIFLDKPFIVGDQVQVGQVIGQVEKIGFRSTRLRTLDKTYITVPNKKMVESELDNLTLRTQRRALYIISLSYDTAIENVKLIVRDIQTYLDEHSDIDKTESRVRLHELGNTSIHIQVLYFVNSPDNDLYINVRQQVNFQIMEIVKKHQGSFSVSPLLMQK